MKIPFRKISAIFVLIFFIFSNCYTPITQAKNDLGAPGGYKANNSKKELILKEKFEGKKLERIKKSIKGKKSYRILIESNEDLEDIKSYFITQENKIKIKEVGNNKYMVRLPLNSQFLKDELSLIDNGILPLKIGNYNVIQPEIFEGFGFLDGEETEKLWGNNLLQVDVYQEELSTKNKVKVGVLDTGIDYTHTDLDDNYNTTLSYDFVNEDSDAIDDNGHGTRVAGIIGAEVNETGRYGVNSNSDLVGLKVLDVDGIGTSYDVLEAIEYAKQNGIKVLNMSFAGIGNPSTSVICEAITDAKTNGIFTVVSAGNSNTDIANTIPAGCRDAIVVGSIDQNGEKTSFSNYGTGLIYAPGVDIYTTDLNNNYTSQNGTSFSSAFVSGLVSKELAYDETISYDVLISNIKSNYNLVDIVGSGTEIVDVGEEESTGEELINTENLFVRFSDFDYLFHTDDYIYFKDKLDIGFVYKIVNDNSKFGFGVRYKNPLFFKKEIYTSDYFNSGKYIHYDEFINERNKYYHSIGYENNNLDETKFSIQSLGLGEYDINHKFENISGVKINNDDTYTSIMDNNYIYYINRSDGSKVYKVGKDGTGEMKLSNNMSYGLSIDDNYIYYGNYQDGYKIYRVGKDGTGEMNLIDNRAHDYITDDDYVYYRNSSDSSKLYKVGKDGTGEMKLNNNNWSYNYMTDSNYVYYRNHSDGDNIYRIGKNGTGEIKLNENQSNLSFIDGGYIYYRNYGDGSKIYKIGIDGTGETKLNENQSYNYAIDGDYIYYRNGSDGYKIYRIRKNGTGEIKISDNGSYNFIISNDYIYYTNNLDGSKIYRVGKDGTGEIKLNGTKSWNLMIDNNHIYYSNSSDGNKIYKIDKSNPEGYFMDDGIYKSPEILPGKNLINLKINIDSTIPTGTNYDFYFASQKTEETLFEANESGLDIMMNEISLFSDNYANGTKQEILSMVNVGDTIYLDNNGNIGEFIIESKNDWSIRLDTSEDLRQYRGGRIYIGGSNYTKIDNSKLDGNTNLDLNSLFGFTTDKLYYKIELIGDTSDTTKTPVINSVELIDGSILAEPTNLTQEILSPYLSERDTIELGEKIGKFQSGSGIILSADIQNDTGGKVRLAVEVQRIGDQYSTYFPGEYDSGEIIVPYYGTGSYNWKIRVETDEGNYSDWVEFGTENTWEYDYALYDGFEPYPYGYNFFNRSPEPGFLTGGISYSYLIDPLFTVVNKTKEDGGKWKIFEKAFDISVFDNDERKMIDAFESLGLDKDDAFGGGNCYGMAVSSTMQYSHPDFMEIHFSNFRNTVGTGTVWHNINSPSTSGTGLWDIYNDTLESILAFQLSQHSKTAQNAISVGINDLNKILSTLKTNTNKIFTLLLRGKKSDNNNFIHLVTTYKVEGNKIYVWDNNFQYPDRVGYLANEQYVEIYTDTDGKIKWKSSYYELSEFTELTLIDMDKLYNNGNKSIPIGFNEDDILYTLSGSSDVYISDSFGRISGFQNGEVLEDIPGVEVIIPLNATLSGAIENTWKQIYLPQKQNLTVKISAKSTENYDLMIAGGDYYTKVSGVETNSGQIDTFIPTRENIQIDFDDNKTGDYDLLIDNFQNSGTGTVYIGNVESKIEPQQYTISWTGVLDNTNNAVIYEIDTDSDGNYDDTISLPPIYQDIITPTTNHTIFGELNTNTTNSYIETVTINLSSQDNDGGTGVDKIYYAIGTDTGSPVYVKYAEPVIVNGIGNYTLNYYATDKFGNIEEVKTTNFSLIERSETNSGKISGYMYFDKNNNGKKDKGEKGLKGFKIFLDLNNDGKLQKKTEPYKRTNKHGYYEFDELSEGKYTVRLGKREYRILSRYKRILNLNPKEGYNIVNLNIGEELNNINFLISLKRKRFGKK